MNIAILGATGNFGIALTSKLLAYTDHNLTLILTGTVTAVHMRKKENFLFIRMPAISLKTTIGLNLKALTLQTT